MKHVLRAVCCRLSLFAVLAVVLGGASLNVSVPNDVELGDLIRGASYSSVYYLGSDGLRYVFPNEKTYFTWYDDFSHVRWISDADLGTIQIGGNVTYKPGEKLVKINTDPKVYAVDEGGTLRWVETEDLAQALYGSAWTESVDDIPDAFFGNYRVGAAILTASEFDVAATRAAIQDINDDKNLTSSIIIYINGQGYSPYEYTIEAGQSVRFINQDTVQHSVTADTLLWGSGTLATGAEFVHTFDSEGTYTFFDSYNSRHTGAIYVTPSTP